MGIVYLRHRSWSLPASMWLLANMGGEDLLFFVLKRMPIPSQLPGLYGHPLILLQPATPLSLYLGSALALTIGFGLTRVEFRKRGDKSDPTQSGVSKSVDEPRPLDQ